MLRQLTDEWLRLLREREHPTQEALRFFCERIMPVLLPMLDHRFRADYPNQPHGGKYDGLISLLGYTPETTILAYKFTRPTRMVILHTPETVQYIADVREYTGIPSGSLYLEQFDKTDTEGIYNALNAALQRFDRGARVAIELTGGTKPMGAALQIAAAVYDIDTIYIDYKKYIPDVRKPLPESTYIRLMENPLKEKFNLLRPAHLGLMAAAAAHELNQPVGIIRSAAQAALLDLEAGLFKPEELRPLLSRILEQAGRLAAVMENFRRFARGNRIAHDERVDLNALVSRTLAMFSEQLRVRNIALHTAFPKGKPAIVIGNSVLLEEVLLNLLSNARDALEGRSDGEIWIEIWSSVQGRSGVSVTDNGPGLPGAYRNLLFVPFMSTKATNRGMGMGLFVSRRVMDELGGHIGYRDRTGGGAVFEIDLPAAEV